LYDLTHEGDPPACSLHSHGGAETGRASSGYSRFSFRLRRFWSRSPCSGLDPEFAYEALETPPLADSGLEVFRLDLPG
jgi:hypothetical protein